MFSGKFKESRDNEIVIEDTTYEAFKNLIRFLYCDELVLKDDHENDFVLIRELYALCDRYDVSRLFVRLTDKLYKKSQILLKSREDFHEVWTKMVYINLIATEFKIEKLMDKVMEFINKKFENFIEIEDNELLLHLNNFIDGQLFTLMADKCLEDTPSLSPSTKLQKFKELLILITKKCKQMNEVIESLKEVKTFNCDKCGELNHVQSFDTSTE